MSALVSYPTSADDTYAGAAYYIPAGLDATNLLGGNAHHTADVTFADGNVTALGILP